MFCQTQIIHFFLVILSRWPYQPFLPSAAVAVLTTNSRKALGAQARLATLVSYDKILNTLELFGG